MLADGLPVAAEQSPICCLVSQTVSPSVRTSNLTEPSEDWQISTSPTASPFTAVGCIPEGVMVFQCAPRPTKRNPCSFCESSIRRPSGSAGRFGVAGSNGCDLSFEMAARWCFRPCCWRGSTSQLNLEQSRLILASRRTRGTKLRPYESCSKATVPVASGASARSAEMGDWYDRAVVIRSTYCRSSRHLRMHLPQQDRRKEHARPQDRPSVEVPGHRG